MARKRKDESLPIAVATEGGLIAALAVLLVGLSSGARGWIVLIKAGTAFVLISAVLKLMTAGVMQGIRWKATPKKETKVEEEQNGPGPSEEVEDTVDTIRNASQIPETTETVAS